MSGTDFDFRHKLNRLIETCRGIASELGPRAVKNRAEQLCELLRFCMTEDYLVPNSSPRAVLESWGLNCTTKLADWEDLRGGFEIKKETATGCYYSISCLALFRVFLPSRYLGLGSEVAWALLHRIDEAVTSSNYSSRYSSEEWCIQQGMWGQVAAKLRCDKIICERALFTNKRLPSSSERYQRLHTAISEGVEAAETRFFTRLSRKGYTLNEYALGLCCENMHYDPAFRLTARKKLNAERRKKEELRFHSIMRERLERARHKDYKIRIVLLP